MGIRCLLLFIAFAKQEIQLSSLRGKVVGIDAYVWLYKGAYCCSRFLVSGIPTTIHVDFFISKVKKLIDLGIKPVLVFDSVSPPLKSAQQNSWRAARREKREKVLEELKREKPDMAKVNSLSKQAVTIGHQDAVAAIKRCRELVIDCLVSPMENDAQLTYLQQLG